jgi:Alginate lyase.
MELSKFELQLPIKSTRGGKSVEIIPPSELTKGYKSEYFFPVDKGYAFRCPTNGYKTENAKYPRSELREKLSTGEWSLKGLHVMNVQCEVNELAGGKGIIIGQIHGKDSKITPQLVKLLYRLDESIELQVKEVNNPSKQLAFNLGKIKLGELFEYQIEMHDKLLVVSVTKIVHNRPVTTIVNYPYDDSYWDKNKYYFKCGCYVQSNDKGNDHAVVTISRLSVFHK